MKIISEILFGTIKESIWFMGNVVTGGNLECLFEQPIMKGVAKPFVNQALEDVYKDQLYFLNYENEVLQQLNEQCVWKTVKNQEILNNIRSELENTEYLIYDYKIEIEQYSKEKQDMIKVLHKYKANRQVLLKWNYEAIKKLNLQNFDLIRLKNIHTGMINELRKYID